MELRHLRYMLAVAEERHFGRAATRLGIAQPPLSRQIQALETELGFTLFDRGRKRVELTPAGVAFATHARRVFELLDLGVSAAQRAAQGQSGHIGIGYPSSLAVNGLAELLRAFRERSPGVEVELHETTFQEQVDAIRAHKLDVGFLRGPLREPGLELRLVRSEPLQIVLPVGHPLVHRKRIPLELLADERFVSMPRERGPAYFDRLMRLCHEAGFVPRIVQHAVQLDIVSLVAAGFGVAILPESMRFAHRPGAIFCDIEGLPMTDLFAAWRPEDPSPVVRDFLDVLWKVGIGGPCVTPPPTTVAPPARAAKAAANKAPRTKATRTQR